MKNYWKNDKLQFARLISELDAIGVFNSLNLKMLGEETDLTHNEIHELIDRAQKVFDDSKKEMFNNQQPKEQR